MKVPKPIQERRKGIRIDESLPFQFHHKGYEVCATTVNISAHGARCRVDREIPLMTKLEIALSLPGRSGAKPLKIQGVVVRWEKDTASSGYLLAIFFSKITPSDEKKLQAFIESRLQA